MGYFNIFYKITRIIDMLTRKRNRKAIMVILIIIAIVCLYKTKVQANESFENNIPYMTINLKLNTYGSFVPNSNQQAVDAKSYVVPVYSGNTYNFKWGGQNCVFGFISDLSMYDPAIDRTFTNMVTLITSPGTYNNTGDFTYTCYNTGFVIIGQTSNAITNLVVTSDFDGEISLQVLNEDLLRIETLLKDYLYGDSEMYDVTLQSVSQLIPKDFNDSDTSTQTGTFINQSGGYYTTYYFKIKNNYRYHIEWQKIATYQSYGVRYGYSNNIPVAGASYINCTRWAANDTSLDFVADGNYKYFYITFNRQIATLISVQSNYNEGQELGLYGGLTDINNQTRQQGEQTRDTITSTDYTESDVNINSDSINNVDTTQTDGLFTTIFNNFNNAATGGVDTISIPLPHQSGNLVLHSNLVSSHLGALSTLVSAFWYFVFGFYAFKFVNNLLHNIKDGSILDGFKNNNEVITQDML